MNFISGVTCGLIFYVDECGSVDGNNDDCRDDNCNDNEGAAYCYYYDDENVYNMLYEKKKDDCSVSAGSSQKRIRLGQHFLASRSIASRIADAAMLDGTESVFELGTGMGILTRELCKRARSVVSVEVDPRLADYAHARLLEFKNLKMQKCNGLEIPDPAVEDSLCTFDDCNKAGHSGDSCDGDNTHVTGCDSAVHTTLLTSTCDVFASNLPYSYSRNALEQLASAGFEKCIIMIQKEFASKLLAGSVSAARYRPGERGNRRAISIIAQYCFEMNVVMDVSASCFEPRPSVNSVVVLLRRRNRLERSVIVMINQMFSYRRKNLSTLLDILLRNCERGTGEIDKSLHDSRVEDMRMLASDAAGKEIDSIRIDDIDVHSIVKIASALLLCTKSQ